MLPDIYSHVMRSPKPCQLGYERIVEDLLNISPVTHVHSPSVSEYVAPISTLVVKLPEKFIRLSFNSFLTLSREICNIAALVDWEFLSYMVCLAEKPPP